MLGLARHTFPKFAGAPYRAMSTTITAASKCAGCEGLTETLSAAELDAHMALIPTWKLNEAHTAITQHFRVRNFALALDYLNKAGAVAESENHHPDLAIRNYNHVYVELSTHSLGGLTTNDIIMAVKLDAIPVEKRPLKKKKKESEPKKE